MVITALHYIYSVEGDSQQTLHFEGYEYVHLNVFQCGEDDTNLDTKTRSHSYIRIYGRSKLGRVSGMVYKNQKNTLLVFNCGCGLDRVTHCMRNYYKPRCGF